MVEVADGADRAVEVADGADRAVEVALLAAVPDGGWEVRTPPMPKTTTPTPTIMVTTTVLRLGIRAHPICRRIRAANAARAHQDREESTHNP